MVQLVKLIPKLRSFPEEQGVYVFIKRQFPVKKTQIIWYASKNHVTLYNIIPRELYLPALVELFTFPKRKWSKLDFMSQSAIEPPMIIDQLIKNP